MTKTKKIKIRCDVAVESLREIGAKLKTASSAPYNCDIEGLATALGRLQGIAGFQAERIERLVAMLEDDTP